MLLRPGDLVIHLHTLITTPSIRTVLTDSDLAELQKACQTLAALLMEEQTSRLFAHKEQPE